MTSYLLLLMTRPFLTEINSRKTDLLLAGGGGGGGKILSLNRWLLVGCFWFNGPLRQYFSLYQAVSRREGEILESLLLLQGVGWGIK